MKKLKKWLDDQGFTVKQTVLHNGGLKKDCLCVDNEYEGPYPGKEQFDALQKIRNHVNRFYRNLTVEQRGHYTSIFIY